MRFPFFDAWRQRLNRKRYDLNTLRVVDERMKTREQQREEPEADTPKAAERNHIYCHHCGASMSQKYSICPDCGIPLGS